MDSADPSDGEDADDLALMARVREGDTGSFERLVERHQSRVVGTVARMLGDAQDAEDIAQQVFIRVWNSAARYRPEARFTTWLFTITRNLVFNELRRRRRHPAESIHSLEESGISPPPTRVESRRNPDRQALDREMQEAIQLAIDQLPEPQRMAIVLRRYEDMPYEEIAGVLSLSVPAVKSLLFRARTQLREALAAYLDA